MILLIVGAWILVVVTVVGLCAAAQAGDRQRHVVSPAQGGWQPSQAAFAARRGEDAAAQPAESLARTAA
jgi:hypothetical protein